MITPTAHDHERTVTCHLNSHVAKTSCTAKMSGIQTIVWIAATLQIFQIAMRASIQTIVMSVENYFNVMTVLFLTVFIIARIANIASIVNDSKIRNST